jgi:dCMP deaminase
MSKSSKVWQYRYLDLARVISTWSKDPSTRVGAVVVDQDGLQICQGYNGLPRTIPDSENRLMDREYKLPRTIHAETNCIFNAAKKGFSIEGCDIYVYGLPTCHACAAALAQVGVKRVIQSYPLPVNERWVQSTKLAREIMMEAGVENIFIPGHYGS